VRQRSFLALAGATFILLVLAIVTTVTGEHAATRMPPGVHAFPALAAKLGDVVSVSLVRRGLRLDFVREGQSWLTVEKGNYPAQARRIRRIALGLADLTLVERLTREKRLYPRLAVEDPGKGTATLVTLKDKSGKVLAALIVGKERADRLGVGQNGVYVRRPGHAQSWLAAGSLDLSGNAASWLERPILDIPEEQIARIALTQPDGRSLVISRSAPQGKFAVAGAPAGAKPGSNKPGNSKPGNSKPGNNTIISEPAAALTLLDLDDVMPAARDPIPANGPGHGVFTARYRTFDGLVIDLRLITRGKTDWIAVSATGSGKAAAAAQAIERRVGPWIYAIPSAKADLLRAPFAPPAKS
jgi:hypothetical protein